MRAGFCAGGASSKHPPWPGPTAPSEQQVAEAAALRTCVQDVMLLPLAHGRAFQNADTAGNHHVRKAVRSGLVRGHHGSKETH